jgi:hypothetical protein
MNDQHLKKAKIMLVIALVLELAAYTIVVWQAGWVLALALFLLGWAHNLTRSADKLKGGRP